MSLRRPKLQIKPKVSTRAMTAKAVVDGAIKKKADVINKQTNNLVNDIEEPIPLLDVNSSSSPLTTSFIAVTDNDDQQMTREVVTRNVAEEKTQLMNPEVDPITDVDKTNTKVHTMPESETKAEKVLKTKTKTSRKRKNGQNSDKSVMTMKDLLLYNPPMTDDQKEMREKNAEQNEKPISDQEFHENVTTKGEVINEKTEDTNVGPRVKVGADGQLILDEESVIVKRKKSSALDGPALLESASTTSACTNYSSFRNKNRSASKHRWTEHETIRFYSALNTIGTDFTLMADLFFRGKRSRLDLRNKFKKEEKINKMMIDEALFSPNTFINQCPELDEILGDSSDSDDDNQQNVKRKSVKQKS